MADYAKMILDLRALGVRSTTIVLWGKRKGRKFSIYTLSGIVQTGRRNIRADIADSIRELHSLLCATKN